MAGRLEDTFNDYKPSFSSLVEKADEYTQDKQNEVFWESIVEPIFNWADGAVKGMQEITRAGNQRATVDPQAFMGNDPFAKNQINLETKPISNPEPEVQETSIKEEPRKLDDVSIEAADWYKKAVQTYTEETVKPGVIAGTIALMGAEGAAAKATMGITTYPLLMEMGMDNMKKYGLLEGAKETGTSLILPKATYETFTSTDPNMVAYRKRYPFKALIAGIAQDAVMIRPFAGKLKETALRFKAGYIRSKNLHALESDVAQALKDLIAEESKTPEQQVKDAIKEQAQEAPKEKPKPDPNLTVEDVIREEMTKQPVKTGDNVVDALDEVINNREQKGIIREDTYDRVADFVLSNEQLGNALMNGDVKKVVKAVQKQFGIDEVKAAKVLKTLYTGEEPAKPTRAETIADTFEPETENIQAMREPATPLEAMNDAARPEVKESLDNIARKAEAEAKVEQENRAKTQEVAETELQNYKGVNGDVKPSASNITDRVDWLDVTHTANSLTDVKTSTIKQIKGILGYFKKNSKEIKVKGHQEMNTLTHELGHFADSVLKIKSAAKSMLEITRDIFGQSEFEAPSPREKDIMSFLKEYALDKNNAKIIDPALFKQIESAIANDATVKAKVDNLATQIKVDAELENATTKIFGNAYKPHELRSEGIAEFFHEYLYNPEQAKIDYPEFYSVFSKEIAKHPEMAQKLDLLGNQVRKVLSQHGFEAGRAAVETTADVEARQNEGKSRGDKIVEKLVKAGDGYRKTMLDEFSNVKDLMEEFQQNTGIKLPSYANPYELLQAARSHVPARLSMLLGTSGLKAKYAIDALRQMYGGINLEQVVYKDIMDSLKSAYKDGDITTDFLDLCGTKNGKRATVYEAFMTFVNALSDYDIIQLKNKENIAKSERQILINESKRRGILKEYDKQFKALDKQIGRTVQNLMNVSPTEFTKSMGKMKNLLEAEKDRLIKKFANDKVKTAEIEKAFDKKIAELTDKVSEVIGEIGIMSKDELSNTYHGKVLSKRLEARRQKRDQAKVDKDAAILQEQQQVLDTNAKKGQYIAESIDKIEMQIEDIVTDLYGKAVTAHTKGVNNEINRLQGEIAKLAQKMGQDKRLKQLADSDVLETTNINEINAGNRDYVTNIKHKNASGNDDIREIIRTAPKSFYRTERLIRKYNNNLLELAVHFGFFDRRTVEQFKKDRPHYVPGEKSFSEENAAYVDIHNFLAKLSEEGSDRTVKDPLMAMQNRTEALLVRGERNKIKRTWTGFADMDLGNNTLVSMLPEGQPNAQKARGVFEVYIDGKKRYYQAHNDVVYDAIMNMDAESSALYNNIMGQAAKMWASTVRVTATQTPFFMVFNMMRDTLTASVNAQATKGIPQWMEKNKMTSNRAIPIYDTIEGFVKLTDNYMMRKFRSKEQQEKLNMAYAQFYAQGVPFATRRLSDAKVTKQWMEYIQSDRGQSVLKQGWDMVVNVKDMYVGWGDRIEQAPRFQEFLRTLQQGGSVFEAGVRARELTTNFARHGTVSKTINQYQPFFNATMQGTYTTYKALKRNPVGYTTAALGWITTPTLVLWAINHDQDWYRNMPAHEKDKFWLIKVGDTIYRYPKPELAGYLFGTLPEMMLNAAYDNDPRAFKDSQLGSMLFESAMPIGYPTAALAITQWRANRDFYRERDIVPKSMQDLPDEEQYTLYTSGLAIKAGQLTGLSPMKIDSTMRTVFTSMGSTALGLSDGWLKDDRIPNKPFWENTRFTHNLHGRTRTQEIFYDRYRDMLKKSNSRNYVKGRDKEFDKNWGIMKDAYTKSQKMWKEYNKIMDTPKTKMPDDVKLKLLYAKRDDIDKFMKTANNRSGYKYIQSPK